MADPCDVEASATSAYTPLVISNNVTWSDAFQFGKPDDYTWSLNQMAFEAEIKRNHYDALPLLRIHTVNDRVIIMDEIQRVIRFNVSAEEIRAALPPGEYVYDLVMMDTSDRPPGDYITGTRTLMMHGPLTVKQGVSSPGSI